MIPMPDSVNVNDLPAGYPAYLGYADGNRPTARQLEGMFPGAHLVILTVNGTTRAAHGALVAGGADAEPGNLTAAAAVNWAAAQAVGSRPVIYASVIGEPGFGMGDVLAALEHARVPRAEVRLLSAHYGQGPHVCGPGSCEAIGTEMDGTQWTDSFTTPSGAVIDMSMLADDFFGPIETETERMVNELGIVRQGMTGPAVRTVQGLCNARLPGQTLKNDGAFGPKTLAAVKFLQDQGHVPADGVVGPQTWPVLLGVA